MTQSYYDEFTSAVTLIDERDQIGPYHLAIGKTKKVFSTKKANFVFFSTGYAIEYVAVDKGDLSIVGRHSLPYAAPAWGGGQFCIDYKAGTVHLTYVSRDRWSVAYMAGTVARNEIEWSLPRQCILSRTPTLAAPWVEASTKGEVWASVVGRDGNYQIAYSRDGGAWDQKPLLEDSEEVWMHSCVQMLPIGEGQALAVGFKGEFPTRMELVYKSCSADLSRSESKVLAPCNVNDQLTFHFQAVGDDERGRAHIAYLADGLRTDYALYENNEWQVTEAVFDQPSFAPQTCLTPSGALGLLVVDYDGQMWHAERDEAAGWSDAVPVNNAPKITISPAYGRTGYGTGGMISATYSEDGTIPYAAAQIDINPKSATKLFSGVAHHLTHLAFSNPPTASQTDSQVEINLPLERLLPLNILQERQLWLAAFPLAADQTKKLSVAISTNDTDNPRIEAKIINDRGQVESDLSDGAVLNAHFGAAGSSPILQLTISTDQSLFEAELVEGTGVTYNDVNTHDNLVVAGRLVDLSPYLPEPNSLVGRDPEKLPQIFRRLI